MASGSKNLKVLLLQIRANHKSRKEEADSFLRYSGLEPHQLDVHNVFDHPVFDANLLSSYDALFIGGTSEANVLIPNEYPFFASTYALIEYAIENSVPTFASCFGYQLAVVVLGGQIVHQERGFEMGTVKIKLCEAAAADPMFSHLNSSFYAVAVHKQKSLFAPPGSIELCRTDDCNHSFRVEGKPFWAFQFHPEVDRKTLVERLTLYREQYTEDAKHLENVLANCVETPESNALLRVFVEKVLC